MLAASAIDITFDDDEWVAPTGKTRLNRAASVGNSWGVTSIGRGFDWSQKAHDDREDEDEDADEDTNVFESEPETPPDAARASDEEHDFESPVQARPPASVALARPNPIYPITTLTLFPPRPDLANSPAFFTADSVSSSPAHSPTLSSRPLTPSSPSRAFTAPRPPPPVRSPTSPRPRRRSSQQRVSLIAGRVSIAPIEPPSDFPVAPQKLIRSGSSGSLLSIAQSTCPPTPTGALTPNSSERDISEFVIQGEVGRGAYGLVKKAREIKPDGTLGPPLIMKQVIKSRILADCWKKHPKHGTIPIEIYVMSAISNTSYVLPPRRPWDPARLSAPDSQPPSLSSSEGDAFEWVEGKVVKGHPNICPLLDFFEDNHYYYLLLPSTTPEPGPNEPIPPSDLFNLIESYPDGLPVSSIRTYLGQIADALSFLHARGIVHRDVKDENVVLGPRGRCILIDFGSSGLVKKGGWDTFSGTLDYAGPEILRGERYQGKEQDVWAYGVVAYVMLVGECPFSTAAEAQEGLASPFSAASIALDERCNEGREAEGEEADGGGALGDAAALVRACLELDVDARPSFDKILCSRFLAGHGGWGM